jgi:hypothetical protein
MFSSFAIFAHETLSCQVMNEHEALLKISDVIYAVLVEFASDGVEPSEVSELEDGLRDITDAIISDLGISVLSVSDNKVTALLDIAEPK